MGRDGERERETELRILRTSRVTPLVLRAFAKETVDEDEDEVH